MSRSTVLVEISYSSASSRAVREPGADALSSSTIAYSRSVRFTEPSIPRPNGSASAASGNGPWTLFTTTSQCYEELIERRFVS